jgi:hypothetical protein
MNEEHVCPPVLFAWLESLSVEVPVGPASKERPNASAKPNNEEVEGSESDYTLQEEDHAFKEGHFLIFRFVVHQGESGDKTLHKEQE